MPSQKRQFGDKGEDEAEEFLVKMGYKIIERNYRIKNIGEIDIVAEKRRKIYFAEVKTRNSTYESKFPMQLSISPKKRKILRKTCEIYLMNNRKLADREWQLDGIFINGDYAKGDEKRIEHLENILWEKYY